MKLLETFALSFGGSAVAAPVFSTGPAVTFVCIRASVVAHRRVHPLADSRQSGRALPCGDGSLLCLQLLENAC
jgi:hypothetical protein